jgi:hypothetical protein
MVSKKTKIGVGFLFLIVFLFSCSSSRKTVKGESPEKKTEQLDESFDPLKLNDDNIKFQEGSQSSSDQEMSPPIDNTQETSDEQKKLVDGFRVQLFATKDIESATIAKKEAEFVFTDDSVKLYIEFDSPYYKLRIGDFQNRDNAEAFREIARGKGYSSSWIVKTKVWSNPFLPDKKEIQFQN